MLFKRTFTLCMLALSFAAYARAQENAGQAQSQVGKARTESQSPTDNQTRRREVSPAQPTDNQNRASDAQNRNTTNQTRTGTDRNSRDGATTTQRTETREVHAGAGNNSPIDAQLASCLLIGNQKEITISQFASERAKHDKVKEFAKQMVKDHTQAVSMLQRFAGPDASRDLSSGDAAHANRSETTVRSTTTVDSNRAGQDSDRNANRDSNNKRGARDNENAATSDASPRNATKSADRNDASDRSTSSTAVQVRSENEAMPDKMLAIQREVAQKCIAMAKHELEQSNNFDQAYVGMQIAEHMGMIAHLETYKSYASPDLGKVIQESLDTAQGHLRHAKELVMEISHDQPGNNRNSATSNNNTNPNGDASNRSSTSNRDKSSRNDSSNPSNRDDATPRREGAFKKDAPKS